FQPTGLATFRADLARRAGCWSTLSSSDEPARLQLLPEAMGVNFAKFPYPLVRLTGTVDMNLMTTLVKVQLTGYTTHPGSSPAPTGGIRHEATGPRPVFINGSWQANGQKVDGRFDIRAS